MKLIIALLLSTNLVINTHASNQQYEIEVAFIKKNVTSKSTFTTKNGETIFNKFTNNLTKEDTAFKLSLHSGYLKGQTTIHKIIGFQNIEGVQYPITSQRTLDIDQPFELGKIQTILIDELNSNDTMAITISERK